MFDSSALSIQQTFFRDGAFLLQTKKLTYYEYSYVLHC